MSVLPGIEVLVSQRPSLLRGRKVALLAHAASVDRRFVPAWDLLASAGARLTALLSPEHGLWAEAQDMEAVGPDSLIVQDSCVPVHSLYGTDPASLAPGDDQLAGAEVLVVDLADVGSRYYTFSATADMAAAACLRRGIEVIVADRPNPLGGCVHEGGPGIQPALRSFVGHFDVPHRHGLTLGELLHAEAGQGGEAEGLTVVRAAGWERRLDAADTGLPWVAPSPNMPTLETAYVYPGGCLLEGTNLSEGRGTTRPFETVGAPFVDGETIRSLVDSLGLPGLTLRPLRFRPMFHKHAGQTCSGVFVHVTDRAVFRPLRTYMAILWAVCATTHGKMHFRTDAYEFRDDVPAIDLLWGSSALRDALEAGATAEHVLSLADRVEMGWAGIAPSFYLY